MKKVMNLVLGLVAVIVLTACSGGGTDTPPGDDAVISTSEIFADENVTVGDDFNISIIVTDADGVDYVEYSLYLSEAGGALVATDIMVDINSDNNYTATIDSSLLTEGNYTLQVDAVGIVGGPNPNSEADIYDGFSVLPVNNPPEWTATEYAGNDIGDHTDDSQELLNLAGKASDADNDALTYAYVEVVSVPDEIDRSIWDNVNFYISNGKVYVSGLKTSNPNFSGDVVIKISVSDGVDTSYTNIKIPFHNV